MTESTRPANSPSSDWQPLYIAHEKIHPRETHGPFQSLRTTCVYLLLGLYYTAPWLQWDQHQAILFDLPARKFYIFNITFWPQDFFYLAWLLIMAGLTLFFVTALAGRIWCGYACPQTVWTEIFIWMERWTEGTRQQQIKLKNSPWTREKILRKTAKQILWISFALLTGITFVGYFTPIDKLYHAITQLSIGPWETFWILFYGFATYGNAGFLREQICKYMCPYARFQSAMFDKDSLIVSYDQTRGEPRGSRKRHQNNEHTSPGDCVDCTLCVQVCPTGIDIRKGLQYECIACAACVDVCNQVMEKVQSPKGLIRYTTQNQLEQRPTRILRPRIFIYGSLLLLLLSTFIYSIYTRTLLMIDILPDRNALYRITTDGKIENVYTLKLMNMDNHPHYYRLTADGLSNIQLITEPARLYADSGEIINLAVRIQTSVQQNNKTQHSITLTATAIDDPKLQRTEKTRYITPSNL